MSKENLQNKTCKELRELAKDMNISGRCDMTKKQLIDAILRAEITEVGEQTSNVSAKDECKIDITSDVEVGCQGGKDENKPADIKVDMVKKMPYIEKAEVGALVAFRLSSGKVKSAKVINKSSKNRKLKLETEYGAIYVVSYDDVIWVRTGLRWPTGVYKLLKGLGEKDGSKEQKVKA
ncbi:MAG: Rho termination factor N-terminal domain-containing protein [Prevotella sp.]|nr:Rho termination factor N-terminal domain-containing protein [Prevotella sp.]